MFTGIIEEVGTVAELTTDPAGGHLRIECSQILAKLDVSSSVSVSGCCLTVTRRDDTGFWCDLAPETLNRTGFRQAEERPCAVHVPLDDVAPQRSRGRERHFEVHERPSLQPAEASAGERLRRQVAPKAGVIAPRHRQAAAAH